MKSKLILLFAIIVFVGLTILLSMLIEKTKTASKDKTTKKKTSENFESKKEEGGKKASGALESMQWMTQVRAYPDVDIPADKFYKAFEYSKENLQSVNDRDGLDQWESIGPNNIGGRSLCIAVHPVDTGTVVMGASSGGLWK